MIKRREISKGRIEVKIGKGLVERREICKERRRERKRKISRRHGEEVE
jgi:hypothetical protein